MHPSRGTGALTFRDVTYRDWVTMVVRYFRKTLMDALIASIVGTIVGSIVTAFVTRGFQKQLLNQQLKAEEELHKAMLATIADVSARASAEITSAIHIMSQRSRIT